MLEPDGFDDERIAIRPQLASFEMLAIKQQCSLKDAQQYFKEHLSIGDYYTEGQQVLGHWFGQGAEDLGLGGVTHLDEFVRLCENLHPHTGEKLTMRQNITRTEIGRDGQEHENSNRRVFYDFTFSPTKSVSIAAMVGDDPRIVEAHEQAVNEALRQLYPGITIRDVYYHKETPQDAAAKVEQVMQANPDISGWAMVGGWPLFTDNALKWQPGTVKCVSVDALPPELAYLRSGHVQLLLAQQVYEWGYRSVEHLINKIHLRKDPSSVKDVSALIPVTRENVDEFARNWEKWLPK